MAGTFLVTGYHYCK